MKTNNRKQVRLANYDYSLPGGYYITICTHERKQLLSEVICVNEKAGPFVKLSEIGQIADEVLHEMSEQQGMRPDAWVIMPDHIHIIVLKDAAFADTLGQFVGKFKSIVSNQWLKQCKSRGVQMGRIWQRNYYDHILRNEADYIEKAMYMEGNPARWYGKQLR